MRHFPRYFAWLFLTGTVFAANAVSGAVLEMNIQPTFGGEPVILSSLRYSSGAGETLSVTRLSYLLSGFALERQDGTWLELPELVAWLDAEQRRTVVLFGELPVGVYRSMRFDVGLDSSRNSSDPAKWPAEHPLNPNLNGLYWSWQGGYIFMALEGQYRATPSSELYGFAYHFAHDANLTRITLSAQVDLTHDAALLIEFDLAALLNAPRPLSFARNGTSTHSRPNDSIAAALAANLPSAFRVHSVESIVLVSRLARPVKPLYLPEQFTTYRFQMSATFPIPDLPHDNPLIVERVALGKMLFSETALSKDGTLSCASCHKRRAAFSDEHAFSAGVEGRTGTRNAMPLFNLAWKSSFFWDGRARSLREQALMPIQDHAEMDESISNVLRKLSGQQREAGSANYPQLFVTAFGSPKVTGEKIGLALEQYLLTLISFDSRFDRAMSGEGKLNAEEQRGFELFMTEYEPRTGNYGADCFHCHGGALFTDHQFHNDGLTLDEADIGRSKITKAVSDNGKFATPSLRNVELTAPYMHDGRFGTLEEVVAHYDHGLKRSATLDPNLAKHPIDGLHLSKQDQNALVAFLKTLTDEQFVKE
jgi:cytochrome c peroxidase